MPSTTYLEHLMKSNGYCTGWLGFDSWQKEEIFFVLHSIQTSSEAHPASYPKGIRGSLPRCEAHYSYPSRAKIKNGGAIPSLPKSS
jgi:hypothetical protein